MVTFSREQVDALKVGSLIASGIDGRFGEPRPVTRIFAKGHDVKGFLYVCGYTTFGEGAEISFSIKEGDATDARLYRIVQA